MALRAARPLRIFCPVSAGTLAAAVAGDPGAIEHEAHVAVILALIRSEAALGNFGRYRGVCEIGFGAETFVPAPDATPTLGAPGEAAHSPTIALNTWIDVALPGDEVERLITAIAALHPWEVPVIELGAPVSLFAPDDRLQNPA